MSHFLQRQFSHIAGLLLTESLGPPLSRKPRRDSSKPFGSFTGKYSIDIYKKESQMSSFLFLFFYRGSPRVDAEG